MKLSASLLAAAAAFSVAPAKEARADLHRFLQQHLADHRGYASDARYAAALVDLDGDGRDEAVVRVSGARLCGTGGCNTYVLARSGRTWREVNRFTITWPPVRVLGTRSNGWRDLSVRVAGGGIIRGYEVRLRFDGRRYPLNPTAAPAEPLPRGVAGRVLIAQGDEGRLLFD